MRQSLFVGISAVIGIILIFFVGNILGLIHLKVFYPRYEDARREVFENTKSYIHGVTQDLAKYYDEYQKGDSGTRKSIQELIKIRFAEVDANKIKPVKLRTFLVNMRGY